MNNNDLTTRGSLLPDGELTTHRTTKQDKTGYKQYIFYFIYIIYIYKIWRAHQEHHVTYEVTESLNYNVCPYGDLLVIAECGSP